MSYFYIQKLVIFSVLPERIRIPVGMRFHDNSCRPEGRDLRSDFGVRDDVLRFASFEHAPDENNGSNDDQNQSEEARDHDYFLIIYVIIDDNDLKKLCISVKKNLT